MSIWQSVCMFHLQFPGNLELVVYINSCQANLILVFLKMVHHTGKIVCDIKYRYQYLQLSFQTFFTIGNIQ